MEIIRRDGNAYTNINNKWHLIGGRLYDYLDSLMVNENTLRMPVIRLPYVREINFSMLENTNPGEIEPYYDDWTYDNTLCTFLCNGGELPEQGRYHGGEK